jgi:mevalonate kinase
MKSARAFAPGKIILFGEHAVVHGQPAIAVPLSAVGATVTAQPGAPGSGLVVHAVDLDQTFLYAATPPDSPFYNALIHPLRVALEALHQPEPDLALTVRSTIPIASGLGSGAALAAALIRALGDALERPFSREALNPLVYEVEKRHHGTPSGIDNTVIVYEQPVYFVRGTPPETFTIARPFTLLVADTGRSSPTHVTVGDVRKLYDAEPERIGAIFVRIGKIVRAARTAIESGTMEVLGPLMDENHALLRELSVSSPDLDRLCGAARTAGAAGAKLSGGGRGGNLIALVAPGQADIVAAALRGSGAVNVIQTTVH